MRNGFQLKQIGQRCLVKSLPQISWLVVAVLFLQLIQIALVPSIVLLFVVFVIIQFGRDVLDFAGFGDAGLGAGFILGAGTLVIIGQLLLLLGIPPLFAHNGTLSVMIFFVLWQKNSPTLKTVSMSLISELSFAVGIAILVFSLRHPWALPFSLPVVILDRGWSRITARWQLQFGALASIAAGWLFASLVRPQNWWFFYQGRDTSFFESLGWIGSEWGVSTHPSAIGSSAAGYHWLSYVFFGDLSHLANLPPWEGLMKFGLPMLQVVFASLLVRAPTLIKSSYSDIRLWILVLTLIAGLNQTRVDSAYFGLLAGICLISLIVSQQSRELKSASSAVVFTLCTSILFLAKSTTALVLAIIVIFLFLLADNKHKIEKWLAVACLVTGVSIPYFFLLNGGGKSEQFFRAAERVEIWPSLSQSLVRPLVIGIIPPFLFLACRTVVVGSSKISNHLKNLLIVAAVVACTSSLTPLFWAHPEQVIMPSYALIAVVSSWIVSEKLEKSAPSPQIRTSTWLAIAVLSLATSLGLLWPIAANRMNRRFELESLVGESNWESLFKLLPYVPLWLLLIWLANAERKTPLRMSMLPILLGSLGLVTGIMLDQGRRFLTYGPDIYQSSAVITINGLQVGNDPPFADDDFRLVGDYIRLNTPSDAILASNNFCCFGEDWFLTQNTFWGGDNLHLAAETRRRLYVGGPSALVSLYEDREEVVADRIRDSLMFANRPNSSVVNKLRIAGVTGYVVNLSLTEHRDWSELATERFRRGNYIYLELTG
jgi:hypothetical protein